MEIKSILYPTDLSEGSIPAAKYAADLVKKYGAKLYILHVVYDIGRAAGWYVPHISMDELTKEMDAGAKKELEKCCVEELRGYNDIERMVVHGEPSEEILKFSEEKGVGMIVMSTHGRTGLDKMIFGSTTSKVVKEAKCPVLTVRSV